MRRNQWLPVGLVALVTLVGARSARADLVFGANDVETVFFIDKSDDRNRVDYGLRLDASCAPTSDAPLVIYWREIEGGRGDHRTHDLGFLDRQVYGARRQRVVARGDRLPTVLVELASLPTRTIRISTRRERDGCAAIATTTIDGAPARFVSVHLTLAGPGRLDFLELLGRRHDGRAARERLRP